MIVLCLFLAATTVVSAAFAAKFYHELWKWAKQCQNARIAVAYKNKVKLDAPLIEWLRWCNQLDKDKDANGRTIYALGSTRIAVIRGNVSVKRSIRQAIRKPKPQKGSGAPPVREIKQGSWSATDQTKKVS